MGPSEQSSLTMFHETPFLRAGGGGGGGGGSVVAQLVKQLMARRSCRSRRGIEPWRSPVGISSLLYTFFGCTCISKVILGRNIC